MTQEKSLTGSNLSIQQKSLITIEDSALNSFKSFWFSVCFAGYMDMYSDLETVANYLNAHDDWFSRCAQPMNVEPLNKNGYVLNIGRFASLGYEVEPKIAVTLDPPENNLYVMRTVPIPNYVAPGYEVQYKAIMELAETSAEKVKEQSQKKIFAKKLSIPPTMTRVGWQLDLTVNVEFPKLIDKLPTNLVQKTGDRLLAQIVRQISPRLTYKVQQDFHSSRGLPIPAKNGRGLNKMAKECECTVSPDDDDTVSSCSNNSASKNSSHVA